MLPLNTNLRKTLAEMFSQAPQPGDLTSTEESLWRQRREVLTLYWDWFTGKKLEERNENLPAGPDGLHPLRYPLQINPVALACRLHSYALWGEVADTSDPLTKLLIEPKDPQSEGDRKIADEAKKAVEAVAYENNLRTLLLEAGLMAQALGAVVIKVRQADNDPLLPSGVAYEYFDPRDFHCRYLGTDYWNLTEAWVEVEISKATALQYGVRVSSEKATYLEYWSRSEYRITIDDQDALDPVTRKPLRGPHNNGFAPFIYFPRERAGGFEGVSLVRNVIGLAEELNSREADIGDSIRLSINAIRYGWNLKDLTFKTLPDGQKVLSIGRQTGTHDQPGMDQLDPPSLPSEAGSFSGRLLETARTSMLTPMIAYGHEEGSQRSGETLAQRMWPFLSSVQAQRGYWTVGLNLLAEYTLRLLAQRPGSGITANHLNLRKRQEWAEMVPIDRAKMIDEVIRRKQENLISTRHAMEMFGDVQDIDAELEEIRQEAEEAAERQMQQMEAKAKLAQKEQSDGGKGDKGDGGKQQPGGAGPGGGQPAGGEGDKP